MAACGSVSVYSFSSPEVLDTLTSELEDLNLEASPARASLGRDYSEAISKEDYVGAFRIWVCLGGEIPGFHFPPGLLEHRTDAFGLGSRVPPLSSSDFALLDRVPPLDRALFQAGRLWVATPWALDRISASWCREVVSGCRPFFGALSGKTSRWELCPEYRRIILDLDAGLSRLPLRHLVALRDWFPEGVVWLPEVVMKVCPGVASYTTSPGLRLAVRRKDTPSFKKYLRAWMGSLDSRVSPEVFERVYWVEVDDLVSDFLGHLSLVGGEFRVDLGVVKMWELWAREFEAGFRVAYQRCRLRQLIRGKLARAPIPPWHQKRLRDQADAVWSLEGEGECPCFYCGQRDLPGRNST